MYESDCQVSESYMCGSVGGTDMNQASIRRRTMDTSTARHSTSVECGQKVARGLLKGSKKQSGNSKVLLWS